MLRVKAALAKKPAGAGAAALGAGGGGAHLAAVTVPVAAPSRAVALEPGGPEAVERAVALEPAVLVERLEAAPG